MKFNELGLSPELLLAVQKLGFQTPTEIQEKSIPPIMAGKDVIGESATGSGKTLAFGTGIVKEVVPKQGLQALVMTPTRELAEQVKEMLAKLTRSLRVISVYGGVAINPQIDALERADVVVGTPGRLLDHIERRTINLSKVKVLVLDEADRMLDMGFIDDVEEIIRMCPKQRQTLFFSATIEDDIRRLSDKYMFNPVSVSAKVHVDPSKLKQVYYDVEKNIKLSLLAHLLKSESSGLVMVFCRTRDTTDFVVRNLCKNKIDAIAIHGGLSQNKRTRTLSMFNDGKVHVMVCTDVAARGLHIDNVSHIYNYEIPADPKDYVHRIGRTARAGEEGKVINLLSNVDYDNFAHIQSDYPAFKIEKLDKPHVPRIVIAPKPQERRRFGNKPTFHRKNYNIMVS